jgi:hypothetical protein
MDACEHYMQVLDIHSPWRVSEVRVGPIKREIALVVVYDAPSAQCPECRCDGLVTGFSDEEWRWIGAAPNPIVIHVNVPLSKCGTHGAFRVGATWQLNCEAGSSEMHVSWLLARHLEVFVPKPGTREQEDQLLGFLDDLLRKTDIQLRLRQPHELVNYPKRLQTLLTSHDHWENIICGYSTYLTDGAFLDGTAYPRAPDECLKEQTLVLKFILTNYRTSVDVRSARFLGLEGLLLREAQHGVDEDRLTELLCAESHYSDICDYIVNGVAGRVLEGETEIWSQEWLTTLSRWKLARRRDPIAESQTDRDQRFLLNHRVLCTLDYCAPLESSRQNGK